MKQTFNFLSKHIVYLYVICALTSFLVREYTSASLWVSLFCLEVATKDEEKDNKSQSDDGSTPSNK
jgi:hypothetical protein